MYNDARIVGPFCVFYVFQFEVNPFRDAVAVQFLSESKVVLFDVFGENDLGEASVGLQLTHR